MRTMARIILLVVGLLAIPVAGWAQALGSVAGVVRDATGAVLPGVTVEAASPALIEKVRTGVTDGAGQYAIVNLPPGAYIVTFTLTGFSTVRREGVEISVNVTTNINAELRVGTVQETITVTGESPLVDVQSAAQGRTVTAEAFKELPGGGSWIQMAALVPAVRAGNMDVGGVLGDQTGAQVFAHGSAPMDGVSMIDGLRIGNMYLSSNLTNMSLSPLLFDQVDVQLSGQSAETGTNGVIMNAIPRAGGNSFSGSVLANGSGPDLQGSNITADLQARGLRSASTTLKKLYDLNGSVGGPIKQDKLWFYVTSRYFTNEFYLARNYPVDVTAIQRVGDTSKQAYGGTYTYDNNGRLTWAISDKQKISGWYAYQYKVDPHWAIAAGTLSPEAARVTTWHTQLSTTKWTYTATNRLLFEAGVMAGESPDTIKLDPARVGQCPSQGALAPVCIAITEQTGTATIPANFTYRAPTGFDFDDRLPSQSYNVSSSYVTGSHSLKVGFELQQGQFQRGDNNDSTGGIWYTTTAGRPQFVTIQAPASGWQDNLNYNLGIFVQDRWTANRLTLSGGIRLDFLNESTEPFTAGPHRWAPNRNFSFEAVENVPNWKDVNPRISGTYDLFGNGKTALKASASRGLEQDSIRYARANNPGTTAITQTQRVWTDTNGDFVPNCDLTLSAANGECLAWQTPSFGTFLPGTRYDQEIMNGWGVRPWNWEFSAGIQQEILPRLSASFGYFRRVGGNFYVMDNEALGRNDFTEFSVTVPSNTLPNGLSLPNGGQTTGGLYDQNFIVAPRNVIKDASQFGEQFQHFDGFDVTLDARLRNGLTVQGGVSSGKLMSDNCQIIDDIPEALQFAPPPALPTGIPTPVATFTGAVWTPKSFCHQETPYLAQYKAAASYNLPWYGIRVSGTFQSILGPQGGVAGQQGGIVGNVIYNETNRATATTLPRPFTLGQANINVIEPGTEYGDRLNQIDLRLTKIFSLGTTRLDLNVDFYNAFNSDAIITEIGTWGPTWRLPLTVIQPRFVKFAARWDF